MNLAGQHGCRMHFALRHEIQGPSAGGTLSDYLVAGAIAGGPVGQDARPFAGTTGGAFTTAEVSISDLDGRADVKPAFALFSDGVSQFDGAYLDDLRLLCRDDTYLDSAAATGNYISFGGTSMASPHVAGVAALVGAADPAAPNIEIVQAIRASVVPLPALAGKTATGGTVDARGAIDLALRATAPPVQPPVPTVPSLAPPAANGGTATPNQRAGRLRRARVQPGAVRVGPDGRLRIGIASAPRLRGRLTLTTREPLRVGRPARRLTLARNAFSTRGRSRAIVRARLSRESRALVRGRGRLPVRVVVVMRDSSGQTSRTSVRRPLVLMR